MKRNFILIVFTLFFSQILISQTNISGRWYSTSRGVFDVTNNGRGLIYVQNANNRNINYNCEYNSLLQQYTCDNFTTIEPVLGTCNVETLEGSFIWSRNRIQENNLINPSPYPNRYVNPPQPFYNNNVNPPQPIQNQNQNQQNAVRIPSNTNTYNKNNSFNRQQPSGVTNGGDRGNVNSGVNGSSGRGGGNSTGTANPNVQPSTGRRR